MSQNRPAKPAATVRRPSIGAGLHLDPLVSATWLYYEDQLTQSEIAELLGVSRATVINYLHEARRQGIVKITIANEHFASMRLAQQIQAHWKLDRCIVIPDDQGRRPPALRVGEAGAQLLASLVAPGDMLGVSWGQTVLALSHAVARQTVADLSVIQITGSMMATFAFSPELCTSNIADRFGARCINLHAPALVSSAAVRKLLYREPALLPQLELLQTCTKLVFGVGDLEEGSTIFDSGTVTLADARPYRDAGATAVIAGRFIDAAGRPVHGALDERTIGLTIAEIDRIPTRICVAGGAAKIEPLRATLDGGHATMLVTDETAARGLMAQPVHKKR
jgi:DNA-binding transcriptional regulator LsrR (DeoR family)